MTAGEAVADTAHENDYDDSYDPPSSCLSSCCNRHRHRRRRQQDPESEALSSSSLRSSTTCCPTMNPTTAPCYWTQNPTLQLLSTPWEYFVTIDQSALWQKHIAWAKPKGSELKAYISSQYSSRMVLLSLLLATEMSVFFNSAPELVNLRQRLSLFDGATSTSPSNETGFDGTAQQQQQLHSFLPFWIGFVLLLNICVTVSGILATFTTWNVVSAVSDSNAHCLLRSSLGQYVTTLSPRLVVASLYLFLFWFLLFVTELIVGGSNSGSDNYFDSEASASLLETIQHFLTRHLHLLLLWGCFLLGVIALFFSIVVPLSAFGRLVLHTGAMGEKTVLSESLELDLLPRGLHTSLVICAHHTQRQKTAVTRQYHPQRQRQRQQPQERRQEQNPCEHQPITTTDKVHNDDGKKFIYGGRGDGQGHSAKGNGNSDSYNFDDGNDDGTASSVVFKRPKPVPESSGMSISMSGSRSSSEDSRDEVYNSFSSLHEEFGMSYNNNHSRNRKTSGMDPGNIPTRRTTAGMFENSVLIGKTTSTSTSTATVTDIRARPNVSSLNWNDIDKRQKRSLPRHHRRIPTTETATSLFLPPATILNLSMSAKEFNDLIDSAIDTSSLYNKSSKIGATGALDFNEIRFERSTDEEEEVYDDHGNDNDCLRAGNPSDLVCGRQRARGTLATGRFESNNDTTIPEMPCATNSNANAGILSSVYPMSTATARAIVDRNHSHNQNQQHQQLLTRHHRRVSSSRFLLQEWAQENSVRDFYGAAPPADWTQEIGWAERDGECDDTIAAAIEFDSNLRNTVANNGSSPEISPSARGRSLGNWLLSPFSSPMGNRNSNRGSTMGTSYFSKRNQGGGDETVMNQQAQNLADSLFAANRSIMRQPLLPNLTTELETGERYEEIGGESFLLGEDLLP